MENRIYREIQAFIKKHHGFGQQAFAENPEIYDKYNSVMDEIRAFDNKRVKLIYITSFNQEAPKEKTGRIKIEDRPSDPDYNKIKFFEGKKRACCQFLDAGFFEGFYAVLIPIMIEAI